MLTMKVVLYVAYSIFFIISTILLIKYLRYGDGGVREETELAIDNKESFIAKLKEYCEKHRWKLQYTDEGIAIRTRRSIYSFGEDITITFYDEENVLYANVLSRPKWKTTIIDYDVNRKNIEAISSLV